MKVISALAKKSWQEPPSPKGLGTTSLILILTMLNIKSSIFFSPINLAMPSSLAKSLNFTQNLASKFSLTHWHSKLLLTLLKSLLVICCAVFDGYRLSIIFFNSFYCLLLAYTISSKFVLSSDTSKEMQEVHRLWIKKRSSLRLSSDSLLLEGTL